MDNNKISDAKVDEMAKSTFIKMCDERSKYKIDSQEKTKHDGNITKLYSSIKEAQKNEAEVEKSSQQLEFDKEKFNKESEIKDSELEFDKEKFDKELEMKDSELTNQRYIADKEAAVKIEQIDTEKKTNVGKMVCMVAVSLLGVALHLGDVKAEKEGYMTDERVSSFDKHSRNPLNWFSK